MTVIVGLVHNGRVILGGDSAGVSGLQVTVRSDPKVFTNGPFVLGFTSSFRMGQLLHWALTPPDLPAADELDRYMATTFIDAVRDCLFKGGWARKTSEQETGGTFLVGVRGRLFTIENDYQVGEPGDGYAAVGCGAQFALGALHATEGLIADPERRVSAALSAADWNSGGVRGPFALAWEPVAVQHAKRARKRAA